MQYLKTKGLWLAAIALLMFPAISSAQETVVTTTEETVVTTTTPNVVVKSELSDEDPIMEFFDEDEGIAQVQGVLQFKDYYEGALDGNLNDETEEALMEYQADHGLPQTGRIDIATLTMMGIVRDTVIVNNVAVINQFSAPDTITQTQTVLRDKGYFDGEVNGIFSDELSEAIEDFQDDHDLTGTGYLNLPTVERLGITVLAMPPTR